MAPNKSLRTYSRGYNSSISGVQALNMLFATNLTARKLNGKVRKGKTKIQIKELPKKIKTVLSDESSLHININDTFDKIFKGPHCNVVTTKDLSVKIVSNTSSTSVIKHVRSQSRAFQESHSHNTLSWFKHSTLPGQEITNELDIEKYQNNSNYKKYNKSKSKNNSSRESPIMLRSRSKLPQIVVTNDSNNKENLILSKTKEQSSRIDKTGVDSTFLDSNLTSNPVFTNSIREKIHCSTPMYTNKFKRILKQAISPITKENDEMANCINESFEEIKNWEKSFPKSPIKTSLMNQTSFKGFSPCNQSAKDYCKSKSENFVTVRRRPKKSNDQSIEHTKSTNQCGNNDFKSSKCFNLQEFEMFYNTFCNSKTKESKSFSETDFENFCKENGNFISCNSKISDCSNSSSVNYITSRKNKKISKKSLNFSNKYLGLCNEIEFKNLVVELDNILINNASQRLGNRNKSLPHIASINSFVRKQPFVRLTRLSLKYFNNFKSKNSLSKFRACRKFSQNFTPKRITRSMSKERMSNSSDTTSSDNWFDLEDYGIRQLFTNLSRINLEDQTRENMVMPRRITRSSMRMSESHSKKSFDKEDNKSNDHSINTSSALVKQIEESILNAIKYDPSYLGPEQRSLSKAKSPNIGKKSVNCFEDIISREKSMSTEKHSEIENSRRSAIPTLFSPYVTEKLRKSNGIRNSPRHLRASVSDTDLNLGRSNRSLLTDLSNTFLSNNSDNISDSRAEQPKTRSKSSRILRSNSNITPGNGPKTPNVNHPNEIESLKNSKDEFSCSMKTRFSSVFCSGADVPYFSEDLSNSILKDRNKDSPSRDEFKARELVVNLTLKDLENNVKDSKNISIQRSFIDITSRSSRSQKLASSITIVEYSPKTTTGSCFKSPDLKKSTETLTQRPQLSKSPGKSLTYENLQLNSNKSLKSNISIASDTDVIESSLNSPCQSYFKVPASQSQWRNTNSVILKAGKSWRRSLLMRRRESVVDLTRDSYDNKASRSSSRQISILPQNMSITRQSNKIVPVSDFKYPKRKTSLLHTYAHSNLNVVLDESGSQIFKTPVKLRISPEKVLPIITAKDIVLKRCKQTEPLPFEKCYPSWLLKDSKKIGEGVYGEVFLYKNPNGDTTVMKVIPIEGEKIVNGERQKKFEEILSEIVVASELSELRKTTTNRTSAFSEVKRICCVKGKYPEKLLELWEAYDDEKGSENDSPKIFDNHQMYIVLDLADGGRDLEAFVFNNASQALSMFKQVSCALAIAEEQLKFEHRDLHWGNVLLKSVDKTKQVICSHKGKKIICKTKGIEATIIDFTLSRIEHDQVVMFNDLGQDPDLFIAKGDYQFDIYRLMRDQNGNDWEKFEPYSNILWLHYIVNKSITALRYKNEKTKIHKENIRNLKEIEDAILNYKSASDFVSGFY